MINKKKLGLSIAGSMTILAACGTQVSVEDVDNATQEMEASYQDLVDTNAELNDLELNMNPSFKDLINDDEEFATVEDESADIIQNINKREDILEKAIEIKDDFLENAEYISTYEGDDLSEEALNQISEEFVTFSEYIEKHQELYQNSLQYQRDFLDNIASEDADYKDFSEGLEDVNENYSELQQNIIDLDSDFVQVNEELVKLDELVKEAETDSSEEENEAESSDEKKDNDKEESSENDDNDKDEEDDSEKEDKESEPQILTVNNETLLNMPKQFPQKFVYDSGINIPYPEEGVKGIYVTSNSAGGEKMESLIELIKTTDLNSMVIDVKNDDGNVTLNLNSDNELINEMTIESFEIDKLMNALEENDIYPIARIVVFKDTKLAEEKPEWSFTHSDGSIWKNGRNEKFVNPYLKEVWDYNVEVAIEAAKLGFKDIQYDYVRFPEGFENRAKELEYSYGHYADDSEDVINMEYRNRAVTDFVKYSKEKLKPYGVNLSLDVFGYAAVVRETPGIGQSFPSLAEEADVISSMIYPSHWGPGNLDIAKPDLEPYKVVDNYIEIEKEIFDELEDPPITRPWLQDFSAPYLGAGNYKNYGAKEVDEQIKALADNDIHEFLLWNAGNNYSEGATYDMK